MPAPLAGPKVSGTAGSMRASLHGESHSPIVGRPWHYAVLATDTSGHALPGAVDTEFVFNGSVVGRETPPTHPLKNGRLNDHVTFPASATAVPLTFRVVVHTASGSVTLGWPIKVRR